VVFVPGTAGSQLSVREAGGAISPLWLSMRLTDPSSGGVDLMAVRPGGTALVADDLLRDVQFRVRMDLQSTFELLDSIGMKTSWTRLALGKSLRGRGLARRALGDPAGAAADIRRSLDQYDTSPSRSGLAWFATACGHAALAGLAGVTGSGISAADGQVEADWAMGLLRKVVGLGYRNRDAFSTDPALVPLRDRPDFRLMMMDLAFPTDLFAR
jgi:hypothetical protein